MNRWNINLEIQPLSRLNTAGSPDLLASKLYHSSPVITWHAPDTLTITTCHACSPRARNTEDCTNQTLIKILKQTLRLFSSWWWWTGSCGNFCQFLMLSQSSVSNWNGKQRKQIRMRGLFFFSTVVFSVFGSVIKRFYQSCGNDDSGLSPLYKYPASHYEDQLKEQRHFQPTSRAQ